LLNASAFGRARFAAAASWPAAAVHAAAEEPEQQATAKVVARNS